VNLFRIGRRAAALTESKRDSAGINLALDVKERPANFPRVASTFSLSQMKSSPPLPLPLIFVPIRS